VYFPAILQGIHEAAMRFGYNVSVFETNGNVENEKKYVGLIKNSWMDGIILASYANIENKSEREYIWSLSDVGTSKKKIPVVSLENILGPSIDAVIVDNQKAAETAMGHLLSLGHTQILHIAAPQKFTIGKLRMEGYRNALKEADIHFDPDKVCEGDFSPISGFNCMKFLLERKASFTAVFAANDQMAIGAMRALLDKGVRIPEDVAIIGLDNNFPSTLVVPSLSSVNFPKFDMGSKAVELLSQRILEPVEKRSVVVLDTELVVRKSTSRDGDNRWSLDW
jgi:DNA-binding LacI/PurR family transcriptional regulator